MKLFAESIARFLNVIDYSFIRFDRVSKCIHVYTKTVLYYVPVYSEDVC